MANKNPHNFANLPKDELKEIAAKGGRHSHGGSASEKEMGTNVEIETETSNQGEHLRGFAAMAQSDPERLREIAAKGGRHSHGASEGEKEMGANVETETETGNQGEHPRGFAAMAQSDPDRLREIAAKGGRHSHSGSGSQKSE
ncbi:hypothetical protein BGX23_006797 [Mortierella sp. AD031]|nr:hypothetical protein BGX23_006797 [Mortierella sp. AD031]